MSKILIVEGAYPINTRTQKILNEIKSNSDYEIAVCSWNRDNRKISHNTIGVEEFIYFSKARYGSKFAKIKMLIPYAFFVHRNIKKYNPDKIIASHWDMLLICSVFKKESFELIYENLDIPTSENKIINKLSVLLERYALLKTNKIILASRFYKPLYDKFFKGEIYVIENLPSKDIQKSNHKPFSFKSEKKNVAFIGGLRYFNVMKNLIDACKNLNIELLFFGDGPEKDFFIDYSKGLNNVHFFGRYNYEDINSIYDMSDIIWAVYPNKDPNVKYAISNKFFESILFCKPCIFANNTLLGDFVVRNKIGFTVDPYSVSDIKKTLKELLLDIHSLSDFKINITNYQNINKLFWEEYEFKNILD